VERVKRAATQRQPPASFSASAPPTAREHTPRRRTMANDMRADTFRSTTGRESVADSMGESGAIRTSGSGQAREIERKLFWYQDAIHEQELQQQLLEQKTRTLQEELAVAADKHATMHPELKGVGTVMMQKEMAKQAMKEKNRLSRTLQVSEERVADAERLNTSTEESINKLRRGRADFLRQMSKIEERINSMVADMKHFATTAHASLDEKEKVEARLKRQQFDYRNELAHSENVFETLVSDIALLDERIHAGQAAEEDFMQMQRQERYRDVKNKRNEDANREMRLGYLQNHVRGQEMDFQRLHRIMGVKFTPEKPDSVQEIVKASLSHEQRNESLLHYVGVQNMQLELLEEEVNALEKEEQALIVELKAAEEDGVRQAVTSDRVKANSEATVAGAAKRTEDLAKLCPVVETLCSMSGASQLAETEDGGMLVLKGCRPDTLSDFLRLIDVSLKELRQRAHALPTASSNEWLRDFLAYHEVSSGNNVHEIRKELETAAQKVKEQKEAKAVMGDSGADTSAAQLELAPAQE